MRHATITELALFYGNQLNTADSEYLRGHLSTCKKCSAQYELVSGPLDDLKAGRVRRLWGWQFNRLWKRIMQEYREMKSAVDVEQFPGSSCERLAYTGATMAYATTAPGSSIADKRMASVYDGDGRLKSQVRADSHIDVGEDGSVTAYVKVVEGVEELKDRVLLLELANDLDRIVLGPSKFEPSRDKYGPFLHTSLSRQPDPKGGLSKAQIERMTISIRICEN